MTPAVAIGVISQVLALCGLVSIRMFLPVFLGVQVDFAAFGPVGALVEVGQDVVLALLDAVEGRRAKVNCDFTFSDRFLGGVQPEANDRGYLCPTFLCAEISANTHISAIKLGKIDRA